MDLFNFHLEYLTERSNINSVGLLNKYLLYSCLYFAVTPKVAKCVAHQSRPGFFWHSMCYVCSFIFVYCSNYITIMVVVYYASVVGMEEFCL